MDRLLEGLRFLHWFWSDFNFGPWEVALWSIFCKNTHGIVDNYILITFTKWGHSRNPYLKCALQEKYLEPNWIQYCRILQWEHIVRLSVSTYQIKAYADKINNTKSINKFHSRSSQPRQDLKTTVDERCTSTVRSRKRLRSLVISG